MPGGRTSPPGLGLQLARETVTIRAKIQLPIIVIVIIIIIVIVIIIIIITIVTIIVIIIIRRSIDTPPSQAAGGSARPGRLG